MDSAIRHPPSAIFHAAVIRLRLREAAVLPPYLGRAAHAALFDWLAAADPALGEALHRTDGPKGFTVSDLLGGERRAGGPAPAGQEAALRITSYDPRLSAVLQERVWPALAETPTLVLGGHTFTVEGVATDPADHPLAGSADPAALAAAHLFDGPTPPPRIELRFLSPTTFRSGGRTVPLPLPGLVFGSYLDRWNALLPTQFSPDGRRFAEECVAVSRYRLETVHVPVEPGAGQVGFVGACTFTVLRHDNYWLRLLHLLADFAFWCGTGYKTTMGLGQTHRR